ncbi:MAG: glutathione peroxidase, partial [Pseudomonadota bacterium]|nr:glutathione peroxidase [Pseudomonadota bacterium]
GKPDIAWNFTKFLIDGDGNVVERFEPGTAPEEIAVKLEGYLS